MKFFEAVLLLVDMIIGVGMFAIPFAFAAAGFWLGTLELVLIAGIVLLIHLLYGEIVVSTKSLHRIPGYVSLYAPKLRMLATATSFVGIAGTLLAYILVGSVFLHNIFRNFWGGSSDFLWSVVIVATSAFFILLSLKKEAFFNGLLTLILMGFMFYLVSITLPRVDFTNLIPVNFTNIFFPYGVLLFAMSGGLAIPDLVILLAKNKKKVRSAITIGTLIPAVVYFIFALAIVGVSGAGTSEEAFAGLVPYLGGGVMILGSIIGFLAVYSSFFFLNSNFFALMKLDYGFPTMWAWFIASFAPFLLYLFGFKSFIAVIGAVGAVAGGIEMALIIYMHHILKQKEGRVLSFWSYGWKIGLLVLIIAGILNEII